MPDTSAKWQSLQRSPESHPVREIPFQVNDREFGGWLRNDTFGQFNVISNEWSTIPISNTLSTNQKVRGVFGHDAITKTLYAVDYRSYLVSLDSETGSVNTVLSDLPIAVLRGFLIGDDIHLFGNMKTISGIGQRGAHLILNKHLEENQSYDRLHVIAKGNGDLDFWGYPFIFCETTNTFLSFRQDFFNFNGDIITEYCLKTKEVKTRECSGLRLKRWTAHGGFVCTADGRYIVILGKEGLSRHNSDGILVYDLNEQSPTPKTSALKCPIEGRFGAILMTNKKKEELSTFGFVNQCYKKSELKNVQHLPRYIIELIAKWVEMEYLHLLQKRGDGHWRISVKDILKSVIVDFDI